MLLMLYLSTSITNSCRENFFFFFFFLWTVVQSNCIDLAGQYLTNGALMLAPENVVTHTKSWSIQVPVKLHMKMSIADAILVAQNLNMDVRRQPDMTELVSQCAYIKFCAELASEVVRMRTILRMTTSKCWHARLH